VSETPTAMSQPPSERPEDDRLSVEEEIAEESAAPRRAGRWRWLIGIVVSVFFLWVAFRQVSDVGHLAEALGSANYLWLAPAVALYLLGLLVRSLRWHILLLPIARIPTASLFGILSIGFLVNNVLPARLGEIARAILVGRRHGISRSAALATIVVERIFDGVVMLLFLGVASATAGARVAPDWLEVLVPLTAAAFGGAGIALSGTSVVVLSILAWVKLRLARRLDSGALRGDGILSAAGAALAAAALLGLLLAEAFDWWWADPTAALIIAIALASEGVRARAAAAS